MVEHVTGRRVIIGLVDGDLTDRLDRSQVNLDVTSLLRRDVGPVKSLQVSINHPARGIGLPLSHGRGRGAAVGLR